MRISLKQSKPVPIDFTQEGYNKVVAEIERLMTEREAVLVRLQTAREMGDLSENGAYKAARFELGSIDRNLRRLTHLQQVGRVVSPTTGGIIGFGSNVTVERDHMRLTFMLVGGYESNPSKGQLSVESPIGRALLGRKAGETVWVSTPEGRVAYQVITVD